MQPYKYNGKEFIEMHGFDTYDYGARGYYPALGRFMTIDPMAEKYYSISPYAYCAGNPVNWIDPDGMQVTLPYQFNRGYRLFRAYEVAKGASIIGGSFVLGKFGVDYYNNQQMKKHAEDVANSLIERANLDIEQTKNVRCKNYF